MSEGTQPPTRTASIDERRAAQRKMLWGFCALSLGVHLGLGAGWLFFPDLQKPAFDLDGAVVKTRLVKLGKPRDEKLLPRVAASPPPPDAKKSAQPSDTPTPEKPEPNASKQPSAADILDRFNKDNAKPADINDIIRDRIGEPDDEGKLDGDKDGTDLTGQIEATYYARLGAHIKRHLEISATLSDEERIRLRTELFLRVAPDGELIEARIQTSSGSAVFDNDVLAAAKRSSPMPAPAPQVRAKVESGIAFNVTPSSR